MKLVPIGRTGLDAPAVALGCMRIAGLEPAALDRLLVTALDLGITFFDHADIYGRGRCEEVFADAVRRLGLPRERLILQSKCGIRGGYYDFSREHILASVEGILQRLRTDYLDILLLHRPDALMEPDEVAAAFEELHAAGKVRWFGVSNHNPAQMELLGSAYSGGLQVNQLQLSVAHTCMINHGLNVNMTTDAAIDRDGGVLDYCRLRKITVQAWSPFQFGFFEGTFLGHPRYPELNEALERIGHQYGVSAATIAIAWILRHPANMQAIVGTTRPERLREAARAADVVLTRPQWYEIYRAAGNPLP